MALCSDTDTRNRLYRTNGNPRGGRAPIGQGRVGGASSVGMWAGEGGFSSRRGVDGGGDDVP